MPRVHQRKARNDIYAQGARIPADTKKGYRIDRYKPFDQNDRIIIPKGSMYFVWSFRYGGTHRSLVRPLPSQLTQSAFLSTVYSWEENPIDWNDSWEDLKDNIDLRIEEIRELIDQTDESLNNMPESLQYSPNGELLQERIQYLDQMINDLEAIEVDEDSDIEEIITELSNITYQGS